MTDRVITDAALVRRRFWIGEIVKISGTFGDDSRRVETELTEEVSANGLPALLDHIRLCGAIPEAYGHDSSEEKLYSKYTDAVLAVAFRHIGLTTAVLSERADSADVEVAARRFSFVADAKAFRLSRTAKNQKDFKIQALDSWKHGKKYALLVAPVYQLPRHASQIYMQAIVRDVCILSFSHLAVLVRFAEVAGNSAAEDLLEHMLLTVASLNPDKASLQYWQAVNGMMLETTASVEGLWSIEKRATLEALEAGKEEGLTYLAAERERIMRLTVDEARSELIRAHNFESRMRQIRAVADGGLLELGA